MDMDAYVRKQAIMSGLSLNLKDFKKQREELRVQLSMLDTIIRKHETYLELLEEDED
jgi:hypothetical protein